MFRDNSWYNARQQMAWPLDETASLLSDDGQRLPPDLLVDMSLRFDSTLGRRAYVGSIYVGAAAVSLTVFSENGTLLAALTKPVADLEAGHNYQLTTMHASVTGWVAFGGGALLGRRRALNLKFSTIGQSKLLPKVARGISQARVTGVQKLGSSAPLTGLVKLVTGNDLAAVKETLTIDGKPRTAVTFNLKNISGDSSRNVLELYSGTCDARPESGTCGDPEPIRAINNVAPDCCGAIYLEFRGCAELGIVNNDTRGLIVDCGASLADACVTPQHLPDAAGKLPNEYDNACEGKTTATKSTTTTTTPIATVTRAPTGKLLVTLTTPLIEAVSSGATVTISGTSSSEVNAVHTVGSDAAIGDSALTLTTDWVRDSENGYLVVINANTTTQPPRDPLPTTPAGRTGLPWSFSFDNAALFYVFTNHTASSIWTIVNGSFESFGGSFGYNRLAGNIGSITPEPGDATASVFALEVSHRLQAGDRFQVSGCEVSGYNMRHLVREVEVGSGYVVAETPWTADGLRGSWLQIASPTLNGGGSTVGGVVAITEDAGKCVLTLSEAHAVLPGTVIVLLGSSVSGYNCRHTVVKTNFGGATVIKTDVTYTAPAAGGLYVIEKLRGGGEVAAIRQGVDGAIEVEATSNHGLSKGDAIVLFGTEAGLGYDTLYTVRTVTSSKIVQCDPAETSGYTSNSTQRAVWFLAGGYLSSGLVFRANYQSDDVALWDTPTTQATGWHCWNLGIETVVSIRDATQGPTTHFNANLVLNYSVISASLTRYWLAEITQSPTSSLRFWQVDKTVSAAGRPQITYTLLKTKVLTTPLTLNNRYRLWAEIRPWSSTTDAADITFGVNGLSDAVADSLGVYVADFAGGTGKVGIGAVQSISEFETFAAKEL